MSVNLQQAIQEQTQVLSEDEMRQVLNFINQLRKKEKKPQTLGQLIDECFKDVPLEVMGSSAFLVQIWNLKQTCSSF